DNRLKRIHHFISKEGYNATVYHIAGDGNPADRPTRPTSAPMGDKQIRGAVVGALEKAFVFDSTTARSNLAMANHKKKEPSLTIHNAEILDDLDLQEAIRHSQQQDPVCQGVRSAVRNSEVGDLAHSKNRQLRDKMVVDDVVKIRTLDWTDESAPKIGGCKFLVPDFDRALQIRILRRCHELKRHCGVSAFQRYVGSRFHWKKVKADCKRHVAACPVTDRDRAPQNLNKAFGGSASWRSGFRPMECWGIDIC
ncbi:hypothetical protein FOZ62_015156, partial [Perkinsus olseni]